MTSHDKVSNVQLLFVQNMLAVRGFVLALMPDFGQVDDVLQETFLTVTARAEDFVEGSNFRAWACSIARFKVLEAVRRSNSKTVLLDADVIEALCDSGVEEWRPEDELKAIEKCKQSLAPQARRAIELRYEQACRPPEIASLMGWSVAAVNVALSRARNVLRECVGNQLAKGDV